ncbi:phage protein Gp27 family protein [Anaerosolibacter sp.]|uniref:phage protein Gp27 family protein n=1 Tax=Anaerosolibacter sp. TaxID=1872527 RepID=UPI0039F05911
MSNRRKHSKINSLPSEIISAVNDAIVNKRRTYKEIEDWLKSEGHDVSESSVQRYGKTFLAKLEKISVAREQAKSIIETSSGLKTEMSEATSTVAFQLLMEMLINTDGKNLDKNALNAIKTLATLERSTVAREKLKLEYDKGVSAAMERMKEQLRQELKNYPDLLEKMYMVANQMEQELKTV